MGIRSFSLLSAAIAALLMLAAPAAADDYPNRPVRIIVPFAPGGINDIAARVIATHLSQKLGKQFIAENKPGAGGVVGTEIAANSPPDGYTLTVVSIANALQPALYKLPYNPHKAFDAVAMFVTSPNTLAVNPDVPAKTLMEFVAYVKSKPGDVHYASGGIGGSLHLGMELFKLVTKTDMVHVPFKGAGPAMIDVIAGNTKATVATTSSLSTHMRSGKLRGLAVSTPKRIAALPDLPTFIEAGLPEYEGGNWIGFAVPAGTPKPVIEKLHKEIAAIQDMPEVQQQFLNRGAEVVKMTPAQFQAYIEREMAKWGDVVKQAGIKAQ
ncbi:MAG TPA: tripartite tricarboxylate transporter substrate binding protein [Xanthobacteraceae bacterium]